MKTEYGWVVIKDGKIYGFLSGFIFETRKEARKFMKSCCFEKVVKVKIERVK